METCSIEATYVSEVGMDAETTTTTTTTKRVGAEVKKTNWKRISVSYRCEVGLGVHESVDGLLREVVITDQQRLQLVGVFEIAG